MSDVTDAFVEEARGISIEAAAHLLGLKFRKSGVEHPQPCPATGGKDRFAFNTAKNSWHCRGCAAGGRDAIGMAAHMLELDLSRKEGLMDACAAVLGRAVPDGAETESEADRAARLARIETSRAKNAKREEERARAALDFREAERRKACGIYEAAEPIAGTEVARYLELRCGAVPDGRALRFLRDLTYWHGQDERGSPLALHSGPAMVAPFIVLTGGVPQTIGCHITWIDLRNPTKYRPALVDPVTGEGLPTKKMRGSKKGGLIPLAGKLSAARWVGGEGIENGLAFAGWEGFRADTLYFAAGDLGNLAGPAEQDSAFAHPDLKKADRNGVLRPVMVPGPVPRTDQEPDDAMWVGDWVSELVLLADGDSERVFTASAMARAKARLARPGRLIPCVWPMAGADFAMMAADA